MSSSPPPEIPSTTFVKALVAKYVDDDVPEEQKDMFVYSVRNTKMEVVLVGREQALERTRQLQKLVKVGLRDSAIAEVEEEEDFGELLSSVEELDLQNNRIPSWTVVARLTAQLKRLRWLHVGRMAMELDLAGDVQLAARAFSSLRTLIVNAAGLTWADMVSIEPYVPQLEELHMCDNGLTTLASSLEGKFSQLQALNFEDNALASWDDDVWALSVLPRLERLIVNGNKLESIRYEAGGFPALQSLSINRNQVATWDHVDQLSHFPSLVEVRFQQNPLTGNIGFSMARQILVARLPKLTLCNGSTVRERERVDAEKLYLQRCLGEREAAKKDEKAFEMADVHPQYARLAEKHGEPVVKFGEGDHVPGNEIVALTLRCIAASQASKEARMRKLPVSLTVRNLKLIFQQAFQLPAAKQVLYFRQSLANDGSQPEPLDDDARPLSYYGVRGGGEILADEIDESQQQQVLDAQSGASAGVREAVLSGQASEKEAAVAAAGRK